CDRRVAAWYAGLDDDDLHLSALTLGEIRRGADRLRPTAPERAAALLRWLDAVRAAFDARVLPIDGAVADAWGRMTAHRTVPTVDGLIAATALVHGLTLATRNLRDVADLGVPLLDPFAPPPRTRG
ncbi:MAG: type II toxin-antitoxin system VapC family toxin, partial [Rhodospirillales bacterium]|nr:type II toxin-antitoxin system VapC family toxin [Rhodospirillales bacterium]